MKSSSSASRFIVCIWQVVVHVIYVGTYTYIIFTTMFGKRWCEKKRNEWCRAWLLPRFFFIIRTVVVGASPTLEDVAKYKIQNTGGWVIRYRRWWCLQSFSLLTLLACLLACSLGFLFAVYQWYFDRYCYILIPVLIILSLFLDVFGVMFTSFIEFILRSKEDAYLE